MKDVLLATQEYRDSDGPVDEGVEAVTAKVILGGDLAEDWDYARDCVGPSLPPSAQPEGDQSPEAAVQGEPSPSSGLPPVAPSSDDPPPEGLLPVDPLLDERLKRNSVDGPKQMLRELLEYEESNGRASVLDRAGAGNHYVHTL